MKSKNGNLNLVFVMFIAMIPVLLLMTLSQLSAAYFDYLETQIELPDGTIIDCYASGDEFFNWLHDEEGYTIIVGEDGYYYYGIRQGDYVVPTEHRVETVNPAEIGLEPWARISERVYQERRERFYEPIERSRVRAPHTGTLNNLVVYIRFADDTEFTIPRTTYDQRFNSLNSSSMRHYFQEVSYYQLDIISHHFPICDLTTNLSYQDSHPRSYYQPYHAINNPNGYSGDTQRRIREHTLLANAVAYIEDEVPADLVIDADNDGYVDNVSFIIRGNAGNWADLLWAHRWVLYTYQVFIHNKRVWDYTFQPENQSSAYVLSHEMFHTLGAPDLYRYTTTGFTPVGPWDLMASGFVHMGAWMKYKYAQQNWITEIPEINSSGTYTLEALTTPYNNAFRIESPYSNFEFFVLEYRKQSGFYESNLPGSGLLVYRIDSRYDGNASGPPDEVYIYRHNGTPTVNGTINLAHYNSTNGRTEINDYTTNPTSFLANGNIGGLHIHDIGFAGDTITFSVTMIGDLVAPLLQQPQNNAFNVSIVPDFAWTHVNVAQYYEFQLAQDQGFNQLVVDESSIMVNSFQLTDPLEIEETYYWRVRSSDGTEFSDWSNPFTFTVARFAPLQLNLPGIAQGDAIWGDFDNDGFLDLLVTGNNSTKLFKSLGNGEFSELAVDFEPLTHSSAAWGDLTNNGYLDIVLIGRDSSFNPRALIYLNNGDETFSELDNGLTGVFNGDIAIGDYNNNGWLDIAVIGESANGFLTRVYRNNGDQTFTVIETPEIPNIALGGIVWFDFNRSGKLDILLTGATGQGRYTEIFMNEGNDQFSPVNTNIVDVSGSSVDVGDYNNNGFIDVLIAGNSAAGFVTKVYANNGDGTFTDIEAILPGIALGEVTWGDFEQNGYLDILISGFNNSVLFRNVNGNFEQVNAGLMPLSSSSAAWADFDNDGDLDIVLTGSGADGAVTIVYLNQSGDNTWFPNSSPSTPENPQVILSECSATFVWEQSTDDETPDEAITYNIRIGTYSGGEDVVASMSDLTTGFRKIPTAGNVGVITEYQIAGLEEGTYYWQIQAVDGSFAASHFTPEESFTVTSVSEDELTVSPYRTRLIGNYPNPFNPETTIRFSLQHDTEVKLKVYNITGQKVATVVDDFFSKGEHSFIWNAKSDGAREMSSGIYFYRLKTKDFQETKRMLYLK